MKLEELKAERARYIAEATIHTKNGDEARPQTINDDFEYNIKIILKQMRPSYTKIMKPMNHSLLTGFGVS